MKTVKYLKTTQSHRKGAIVSIDDSTTQFKQLLDRGFIEIYQKPEEVRETKVVKPKETKPAKPKQTKVEPKE